MAIHSVLTLCSEIVFNQIIAHPMVIANTVHYIIQTITGNVNKNNRSDVV